MARPRAGPQRAGASRALLLAASCRPLHLEPHPGPDPALPCLPSFPASSAIPAAQDPVSRTQAAPQLLARGPASPLLPFCSARGHVGWVFPTQPLRPVTPLIGPAVQPKRRGDWPRLTPLQLESLLGTVLPRLLAQECRM